MVADPAARPEVFPTDRLLDNGMARPELRQDLRRIDDVRNAVTVASVWLWVAVIIGGAVVDRPVVVLPGRLRPDGPDVRPVRHPDARGRPQAAVHRQAGQRLGGHLADRLPHLDPHLHLPARPLRPPQRGVRAHGAGHRLLRRLPVRPADPGTAAWSATRSGISGWKNFTPLFRPREQAARRVAAVDPRCPGRPVGGHVGGHRPVVDLPPAVVAPLDDPVAGDQPAPGHRRARRPRGQPRPAGHHPQRAPVAGSPGSGSSPTTPGGTWPTTWTWASRSATCPPFHAELERAGYVTDGITYPNYRSLWRALASA